MEDAAAQFWSAIVGLVAALTAGDLMTAQARLRRRLDKTASIAEKLPEGDAKRQLTRIAERDALDLAHRMTTPTPIRTKVIIAVSLIVVLLAIVFAASG